MKNNKSYFTCKKHFLLGLLSVAFFPTVLDAGNTNAKPNPYKEAPKFPVGSDERLHSYLSSLGAIVGNSGPTCFIAHCNDGEDLDVLREQKRIVTNLKLMGIKAIYDENGDLEPGENIFEFMKNGVENSDFVLFILTPLGKQKVLDNGPFYPEELKHVERRIRKTKNTDFLIPVLMAGKHETAVPEQLEEYKYLDSINLETGKFDSAIFWEEMWPLFEQRFFRSHPKLVEIKTLLDRSALEIEFRDKKRPKILANVFQSGQSELDEPYLVDRNWRQIFPYVTPFYLPPENDSFIESSSPGATESYLTTVWKSLVGDFVKYTITGMGGIGKSQLALAYAYEAYRNNGYEVIYWIRSETEEAMVQDYKTLLEALGITVGSDNRSIISSIIQNLPKKRWLLILDNVPSTTFIKDKIPAKNGHILMTSRDQHGWLPSNALNLGVFQEEEAVRYLFGVTGIEETEENLLQAKKLSETLGYLPLALSHAAGYIREMLEPSFGEYNQIFIRKAAVLLSYHPEGEDYPHAVATTWAISTEKLSPLANQLLTYFSYLEPDHIDPEWFVFLTDAGSIEEIEKAVKQLQRYSMVKYGAQEKVTVHRLVQLVERIDQQNKGTIQWTLNELQEQWIKLWRVKDGQYGMGLFSIFPRELSIDELIRVNSSSHKIYRHLKSIKKYIEELSAQQTTGGIPNENLQKGHVELESLVETIMDTTYPMVLSRYRAESRMKSNRQDFSFVNSLAEGLSVSYKDCEFLLEVAYPFLPENADGQECFEILLALGGRYGGYLDSTVKANLKETVAASIILKDRLISPNGAKHIFEALRQISRGKKESAAAKSAQIITKTMNGRNIEKIIKAVAKVQDRADWPEFLEKAENIKRNARTDDELGSQIIAFSEVFPDSWEVFCNQVSQMNIYAQNEGQYHDIMEIFSNVAAQKRDDILYCTKLLSGNTSEAENVRKIIRTLDSLQDDIARITNVILRHPEISSTDTKCRLMEALQGWSDKDTDDTDNAIGHALAFSETYEYREIFEAIASIRADEREEIMIYANSLYEIKKYRNAPDLIKLVISIESNDRASIINPLKEILTENKKLFNFNSLNGFVEILKQTPEEGRNDFVLLSHLKYAE